VALRLLAGKGVGIAAIQRACVCPLWESLKIQKGTLYVPDRFFRVDESFRAGRVDESFRAGTRAGLTRARSLNTWFIRNETR